MAGEQSYGDTWVNVSFSMSPEGVEEIFEIMTKVVPEQPFEDWTSTWGKVRTCLDVADEWACAQGRADHRRLLKRLSSLLLYGEWGATPLDVPPHPKIAGACLMPASYEEATSAWSENFAWNQRYLVEDLLQASKVLTVLAWHLSLRANRKREFEWCRSGSMLLRKARSCLRAGRNETEQRVPGRNSLPAASSAVSADVCGCLRMSAARST
eukprot:s267_g33.t1